MSPGLQTLDADSLYQGESLGWLAIGVTGVKVTVSKNRFFLSVLYLVSGMSPGLQTWDTDSYIKGKVLIVIGVTGIKVKVTVSINRFFPVLYLAFLVSLSLQTGCTDSLY